MVRRFVESVVNTAFDIGSIEIILCVDIDDFESVELNISGVSCKKIVCSRSTMGYYNSACLAAAIGEIIVLGNDDVIIRTNHWDKVLLDHHNSIPDGIYLAYPNDLLKSGRLCTFPILSRNACKLIGDPFPEAYKGAFIDYHLMDIFFRLQKRGVSRLFYLKDVVFEHLHFRTGKSKLDETYRSRDRFADDMTFLNMRNKRKICVATICAFLNQKNCRSGELKPEVSENVATNYFGEVFRAYFVESGLPFKWRLFFIYWFVARRFFHLGQSLVMRIKFAL